MNSRNMTDITVSMQEQSSTETDRDQWRTCTWRNSKGADLKEARANAYTATEWVFDNKYMRHDIGKAIDEA